MSFCGKVLRYSVLHLFAVKSNFRIEYYFSEQQLKNLFYNDSLNLLIDIFLKSVLMENNHINL